MTLRRISALAARQALTHPSPQDEFMYTWRYPKVEEVEMPKATLLSPSTTFLSGKIMKKDWQR